MSAVRRQPAEQLAIWRMSSCLFSACFLQSAVCLPELMPPCYCIRRDGERAFCLHSSVALMVLQMSTASTLSHLFFKVVTSHYQDVISGSKSQTEQDLQGNKRNYLCNAHAPGLLQPTLASNLLCSPVQPLELGFTSPNSDCLNLRHFTSQT